MNCDGKKKVQTLTDLVYIFEKEWGGHLLMIL